MEEVLDSCLRVEVERGRSRNVAILLEAGVIDSGHKFVSDKQSALEIACERGRLDIVRLLLAHCFKDCPRPGKTSAMELAAGSGNVELVQLLYEHADTFTIKNASSGLRVATRKGHPEVMKFFIDKGAQSVVAPLEPTVLEIAALEGNVHLLNFLLDSGFRDSAATYQDPDTKIMYDNWFTLHFALSQQNFSAVLFLVENDYVTPTLEHVANGVVPLAVIGNNAKVVRLLLEKGFSVHGEYQGESSLHCAILNDQSEMIDLLLESGAKFVLERNEEHMQTSLHKAARSGSMYAAELLMAQDVNLNAQDQNGDTALSLAVRHDRVETASFLVASGARIDILNTQLLGPLCIAQIRRWGILELEMLRPALNTKGDSVVKAQDIIEKCGSQPCCELMQDVLCALYPEAGTLTASNKHGEVSDTTMGSKPQSRRETLEKSYLKSLLHQPWTPPQVERSREWYTQQSLTQRSSSSGDMNSLNGSHPTLDSSRATVDEDESMDILPLISVTYRRF